MNKRLNIDFYKNRKIFFAISIAFILIGLVVNLFVGAKLDIQFAGGAMVKYAVTGGDVDANEVEEIIQSNLNRTASVSVNETLGGEGAKQVTISFAGNEDISVEDQKALAKTLTEKYDKLSFDVVESSSVDPVMGSKFLQKCLVCLALTVALLLVYISIRFRKIGGLAAGVTAVIALLHDVLFVYFVFVIFRMPINDIFIAVVLTILGYSLNDTIVIYDRIRENSRGIKNNDPIGVMNKSLNQVFMRSILTSVTTFIALFVVWIVAMYYGIDSVTSFALPMMIGIVSGCYSSLFIALPLYTMHKLKKAKA